MRKTLALKTLLRSPLKTLLTFLLIAAASFALFSRVTDYAVTTRETKNAESLYHAVASLNNEVPDIPVIVASLWSSDRTVSGGYDKLYEMEDKPWLTEEQMEEFASLPGVTLADTSYMTAGQVEDYKRLSVYADYTSFVMFEGTYQGYEEGGQVLEDHICIKFDDVKIIAGEDSPEMESAITTGNVAFGEMYYARSPYTRAFYESLETGSRCLVLAQQPRGGIRSEVYFAPYITGEGSLCVIDGQPDNYLETEAFARQKAWVDAINYSFSAYDVVYTSDMRAMGFHERSLAEGRLLTAGDTDVCVVCEDLLKEHGLSIGDSINIQLGNKLYHDWARAVTQTGIGEVLDAERIPEYVESAELTIVGAYPGSEGDNPYYSPNSIYVPSTLLPVEVPEDYEPTAGEFNVFVENAGDIETFYEAAQQFARKVDLELEFSDRGWLDVKDSFEMGAVASFMTTVLYVIGAALALFLAVYLYLGRNKKSYAIMRTLGVPGKAAANSVVFPFVAVSVLAVPVGGIAGLFYAQDTAKEALLSMEDSVPAGYVPDATLPVGVAFACLLAELLFVSLAAYFFLRNMKKTPPLELLQEGVKPGRKEKIVPENFDAQAAASVPVRLNMAKLLAAEEWMPERNYGAIRQVSAYIRRHMRRAVGKTAVSLILAVVLAAGIGSLVLAGITYRNAYYALGVKGEAVNYTYTSVVELSKSSLIKEFYCCDTFAAWVQGMEDNVPMTIASDVARNLGDNCEVDYLEGYDFSAFEGTGPVCLVGKGLADDLGISPGDEINMMSDFLYFILKDSEQKDAVSDGYKTYKVIGVIESGDENVSNGIFAGIKSDLQRLFSMDFTVTNCEFTLVDNDRIDELENLLEEKKDESYMYSPMCDYHLSTGGLTDIERIRGLLESLFPIAVAAAVLIGIFGTFLVILQSAQEAAFLRILGVTKKRARCMLVFEQIILSIAGIVLVAGGIAVSSPGLFTESFKTLAPCYGLYLLGCVCGAAVAAVQMTRRRILELLQVKE